MTNNGTELLINVTPRETRVAFMNNGILKELHIERENNLSIVGNIYKGKVVRVLPSMQSAFIDIGLNKNGFLHATDIITSNEYLDESEQQFMVKNISALVYEGQSVIVQVLKDPIGSKGAKLTTDISIPSRYLVFMPDNNNVAVSRRIESEEERERLIKIVSPLCSEFGGYIIRTSAEGLTDKEFLEDALFLKRVWQKVLEKKKQTKSKSLLYGELDLTLRILRDFVGTDLDMITLDSTITYNIATEFCNEFIPALSNKIQLYKGPQPLFFLNNIENKIQEALNNRVNLSSGGYLIIEQTEAMTTIDINTGAFVGTGSLEETVFNINLEATPIIAQQIQLRNLAGIIIIDFIDMSDETHKETILETLRKLLLQDRVKTHVYDFSALGLVEIARKRTKKSLEELLCETCSECKGRGAVKTLETLFFEIMREIVRLHHLYTKASSHIVVYASNLLAEYLVNENSYGLIAEVELFTNKQISIKNNPFYKQEEFDVVFM